MYVFDLVKPGVWLEGVPDPEQARETESLLYLLESTLVDAALSLWMFDESRLQVRRPSSPEERSASSGPDVWRLPIDEALSARAKWWAEGAVPDAYVHRIPFLHAKSCLYALDTIAKAIHLLAGQAGAPETSAALYQELTDALPALKDVRDAAHHPEDRVRGRTQKGAKIRPKAIDNAIAKAPEGSVLFVDTLSDNRYGGTTADGHYREVEISAEAVGFVRDIIQRVHLAYQWKGPIRIVP